MNKLFDINELTNEAKKEETKDRVLCEKFLNIHSERIENIKFLTKRFPDKDEIFFLWTLNSFNAFTFVPYIIKECSEIENIIISTYSINRRIIDSFINYIDKGKIKKVSLNISDSLRVRMPKVVDHLNAMANTRAEIININYVWNHSKITLIKTNENYFCIEGSGNWSENAQFEQYIFINSENIYNFRKNCINGINQ